MDDGGGEGQQKTLPVSATGLSGKVGGGWGREVGGQQKTLPVSATGASFHEMFLILPLVCLSFLIMSSLCAVLERRRWAPGHTGTY